MSKLRNFTTTIEITSDNIRATLSGDIGATSLGVAMKKLIETLNDMEGNDDETDKAGDGKRLERPARESEDVHEIQA